jgi:hypothetical protein
VTAGSSLSYAGLSYRWRPLVLSAEVQRASEVTFAFRVGTRFERRGGGSIRPLHRSAAHASRVTLRRSLTDRLSVNRATVRLQPQYGP